MNRVARWWVESRTVDRIGTAVSCIAALGVTLVILWSAIDAGISRGWLPFTGPLQVASGSAMIGFRLAQGAARTVYDLLTAPLLTPLLVIWALFVTGRALGRISERLSDLERALDEVGRGSIR